MVDVRELLGRESKQLLDYRCTGFDREQLHLPGPDFIDRVVTHSNRFPRVLRGLQSLFGAGRLAGTGYLSILPIDQGIEHTAGSSFVPNPQYLDPEQLVRLAIEGGCNGIASSLGILGSVARRYAHRIPFILKLNHSELMTYPNSHDQRMFASVRQAFEMGAVGVGATVYFGSEHARRQLEIVRDAFEAAHRLGLVTVLWCYVRNEAFRRDGTNYETAVDLTAQSNYLGVNLEADIIKQKLPTPRQGFADLRFGRTDSRIGERLLSDNPIDLVRYQVAHCSMGRVGLINSGGPSGRDDFAQVVRTAVINKRAGGMGVIAGRKAFQRPFDEGVRLLHAIQDVYLNADITVA